MNLRLTPAITIVAMLMMGIALIHMAPHQAEAQSNHCRPLNLGAEIVNGDPVLTWLGFTQFKRRRQGNLQVGGTERPGVPECRGQRPTVRNLPTPATGGV